MRGPREFRRFVLEVLGGAREALGREYVEHGLELVERAFASAVHVQEVAGLRERVYAHYAAALTPYAIFEAELWGSRAEVLLAYNVSPLHPQDPWLPPPRRREGEVDCVAYILADVDLRSDDGGGERVAREGLAYFNAEKAWSTPCTAFSRILESWCEAWIRRRRAAPGGQA